jgi:hypothetical protein
MVIVWVIGLKLQVTTEQFLLQCAAMNWIHNDFCAQSILGNTYRFLTLTQIKVQGISNTRKTDLLMYIEFRYQHQNVLTWYQQRSVQHWYVMYFAYIHL